MKSPALCGRNRIESHMIHSSEMSSDPQTLIKEGQHARRDGRLTEAKAAFTRAVNLSRDLAEASPAKTDAPLAQALACLGRVERDLGEVPASLQHYQESAELYRQLNQPLTLAHTIRHVADILRENGDLAPATTWYDEALLLYRDQPDTEPLDLANTLRGYAHLKAGTGHPETAVAYWQEARTLYDKAKIQAGIDEADQQIALLTGREQATS